MDGKNYISNGAQVIFSEQKSSKIATSKFREIAVPDRCFELSTPQIDKILGRDGDGCFGEIKLKFATNIDSSVIKFFKSSAIYFKHTRDEMVFRHNIKKELSQLLQLLISYDSTVQKIMPKLFTELNLQDDSISVAKLSKMPFTQAFHTLKAAQACSFYDPIWDFFQKKLELLEKNKSAPDLNILEIFSLSDNVCETSPYKKTAVVHCIKLRERLLLNWEQNFEKTSQIFDLNTLKKLSIDNATLLVLDAQKFGCYLPIWQLAQQYKETYKTKDLNKVFNLLKMVAKKSPYLKEANSLCIKLSTIVRPVESVSRILKRNKSCIFYPRDNNREKKLSVIFKKSI